MARQIIAILEPMASKAMMKLSWQLLSTLPTCSPWQLLAKRKGARLRYVDVLDNGEIGYERHSERANPHFGHVSTLRITPQIVNSQTAITILMNVRTLQAHTR